MRFNIPLLYVVKISKWFMLTMPVIFLFYRENGLGTRELFILKAVYAVSIVIMEVPSGYFGDMWGRRKSLIAGSVLGFLGFALYCFSNGFYGFLVCEVILGVGQSFISGSDSALLYDTLLEENRGDEYLGIEGKMVSVGNFAEAVAAPVGVLLAAMSLRTTFCFQALTAFTAVPAAFFLVEPARRKTGDARSFSHIFKIIRYALKENHALKWNIAFSSVIGTATLTMAWFVQPYLVFLAIPLGLYGVIIPLLNLSVGTVSMFAQKIERRVGRSEMILLITPLVSCGYFFLGYFEAAWAMVFLFLFYGVRGVATPVLRNRVNEITPSEVRATVLSVRSLIIRLAFFILGPFLGWHADRAGLPATLIAGGALFLVPGVVSALFVVLGAGRSVLHGAAEAVSPAPSMPRVRERSPGGLKS